jgi:hypothetical protein
MKLHDLESWDEAERRRQEQKASQQSSRNMLHAQAKEISDQYSEENKKLTLKMNLEKVGVVLMYLCVVLLMNPMLSLQFVLISNCCVFLWYAHDRLAKSKIFRGSCWNASGI